MEHRNCQLAGMLFGCAGKDTSLARHDSSGRPKNWAVVGRLGDIVDMELEGQDGCSLGSVRKPAYVSSDRHWVLEVDHSPVGWNLLDSVLDSSD